MIITCIRLTRIDTGLQLYKHLLRECKKLPKEAGKFYAFSIKQVEYLAYFHYLQTGLSLFFLRNRDNRSKTSYLPITVLLSFHCLEFANSIWSGSNRELASLCRILIIMLTAYSFLTEF